MEIGYAVMEDLTHKDRIFGNETTTNKVILNPTCDWSSYLDSLENQSLGRGDNYSCVTYAALKCIATIFNFKIENGLLPVEDITWLEEKGYVINGRFNASERFTSVLSGTVPNVGNSGSKVNDTIRNMGLIPQAMLDFNKNTSIADFFNEDFITNSMTDLGLEFANRFDIAYEHLYPNDYASRMNSLKYSPLVVFIACGCPWVSNVQQACWKTTDHAVCFSKEGATEDLLPDTYTRKQSDGSYKNFRRVTKDFKYYYVGYVYFINSKLINKEEDMIRTIKKRSGVASYEIYMVIEKRKILRAIAGMGSYTDLLDDGVISPFEEVDELPEGYEIKERITICK